MSPKSKSNDFNTMGVVQLKEKLSELRMELIKHNAQIATGTTPKSPGLVRQTKRSIARLLTILKSKQDKEEETKKEETKEVKKISKPKKQEGEDKKV